MADPAATLRIDMFLWYARLAKTRAAAQEQARAGLIRLDGRRVERAHVPVRVGSVIALVHGGRVRVLRVAVLPARRGPPAEALALYEELAKGVDAQGPAQ